MPTINITPDQQQLIDRLKKELEQQRPELLRRLKKSNRKLFDLAVDVLVFQSLIIQVYEVGIISEELLREHSHNLIDKLFAEGRQ